MMNTVKSNELKAGMTVKMTLGAYGDEVVMTIKEIGTETPWYLKAGARIFTAAYADGRTLDLVANKDDEFELVA